MSAVGDALDMLPEAVFADVLEHETAYLYVVDVPGASAEAVDVNAESGRVRVEARREKSVPAGFSYVSEERSLFLDAELPVPPDGDPHGATGSVERGVVEIRVPKSSDEGTTIPVEDR